MSESIERHITTVATSEDGTVTQVTHTSVRVSTSGDCFDPERCCDERERALIAAMRAYLRPQHAPQSLIDRLEATLDHCCESGEQADESKEKTPPIITIQRGFRCSVALFTLAGIRRLDACRDWRPSYDDPCAYVRACP